jgi:aminobenzoyl-glutamate utilization protein B
MGTMGVKHSHAVREAFNSLHAEIVALFRTLWAKPELPGLEVEAMQHLSSFLEKHGFSVRRAAGDIPTAFTAGIKTGKGPRIAFLAEYDALPGLANSAGTARDTATGGAGHGCGHNHIGPANCGAAIAAALAAQRLGLGGEITVIGCPAEEILWGKIALLRQGVFKGQDVILTSHGDYQTGAISRPCMSVAHGEFIFLGKAGHGGLAGKHNALEAAETVIAEVSRQARAEWADCSIKHVLRTAGIMPSITPDEVRVWFTVRHVDIARVRAVYDAIEGLCRDKALEMEVGFRHQPISESRGYLPNDVLGEILQSAMARVGPPRWSNDDLSFMTELGRACGGSSTLSLDRSTRLHDEGHDYYGQDDGEVSWHIPLGRVNWACPQDVPIHHWGWTALSGHRAGDAGPLMAAEALATAAVEILANPDHVTRAQIELKDRVKDMPLDAPRLGAWKTMREDPQSFWNATWVE